MRITLTLQEADGQLFNDVRTAAGMEFVEPAVYARHLFLFGLKAVARSHDVAEKVSERVPELKEAKAAKKKAKRKATR